jgi:hypothetical protein
MRLVGWKGCQMQFDTPITLAVAEFPLPEGAFGEPQLLWQPCEASQNLPPYLRSTLKIVVH